MSDESNVNPATPEPAPQAPLEPRRRRGLFYSTVVGGVLAALILGAGAGAFAMRALHPGEKQVLLEPMAITEIADGNLVAVKGNVAEVFGNKFIVADASGRALVETGREGRDGDLVKVGEAITAQGRFEDGFIRASMLVHADGKVDELRAGPPHGPFGKHGWDDRRGGPHERGPGEPGNERGPDAPPPPPAPPAPPAP